MDGISAIKGVGQEQLSPAEKAEVAKLAARDREVRAHEARHAAAAGAMAGGIQYTYQTGPDGKQYAVGGTTQVMTSPGGSPEQALEQARQLAAAANAVSDPSGKDLAVAARARQMEAQALQAIAKEKAAAGGDASASKWPASLRGFDRVA